MDGSPLRENRTDYRLRRRAVLRDVEEGVRSRADVCDAHPELLRAAVHVGEPKRARCPLCDGQGLRSVHYAFPSRGPHRKSGRVVAVDALARQAEREGDLTVYVVEVCIDCAWHHLLESYRLLASDTAVG